MDDAVATIEYNYRDKATHERAGMPWFTSGELHSVSIFLSDGDSIYHTYSTSTRGTGRLNGMHDSLDLTPLGRQEDCEEPPGRSDTSALGWVRHHDKYSAKRGGQAS